MKKWDWKEFILFWAQFYDERKYPDKTVYFPNVRAKKLSEDNIRKLFEWKNGMSLSGIKGAILMRAINRLELINTFKKRKGASTDDVRDFFEFTNEITKGFVWRIFIVHIARPKELPMIDQFVFRSYKFLTEGKIMKHSEKYKNIEEYFAYRDFFNNLMKKSKADFRTVDKALMAFGQFLNNPKKFIKGPLIKRCK